jgi:hypothetical protein
MKKEYNRLPEAINGVQSVACCGKCRVHPGIDVSFVGINNNKKKWNEVSVDFILFDGKEAFLCLELKNEIRGKKALLSAYCQAFHRVYFFRITNKARIFISCSRFLKLISIHRIPGNY